MDIKQTFDLIKMYFVPMVVFSLYLVFPREQYLGEFLSEGVCILSVFMFALYVRLPVFLVAGLISMTLTIVVAANVEAEITMLTHIALTFVLLQYANKESVGKILISAIVMAFSILIASYYFFIFKLDYEMHPPGLSFFGSKVGLLNVLMIAFYSLCYFYFIVEDKGKKTGLYIALVIVLVSLFMMLSKQVFVAIFVATTFLVPLLWVLKKRRDAVFYISVVVVSYVIFNLALGDLLRNRIEHANLTALDVSSDMVESRILLESLPSLSSFKLEGFDPYKQGTSECHKANNYRGCLVSGALCRESYLAGYINTAQHYDGLIEGFFDEHKQLAKYLGTDAAKVRWLSVCSKRIVVSDTSDRFLIIRKGLSAAVSSQLIGAEDPIFFKAINWYSPKIEAYHGYHNFIFDMPYYYGIIYFLLFCFLLLLSMMHVIRGDVRSVVLGAMLLAFVSLRLLSGGLYEMFYIVLLMAVILLKRYLGEEV